MNSQQADNVNCVAYQCMKNTDSREKIEIYDINVIDYKKPSLTRDDFLAAYIKSLGSGFKCKYSTLNNLKAVEYEFKQEGFTIKSIITYYKGKSYTLTVTTMREVSPGYEKFTADFLFLDN